jgi:hypothetical protein
MGPYFRRIVERLLAPLVTLLICTENICGSSLAKLSSLCLKCKRRPGEFGTDHTHFRSNVSTDCIFGVRAFVLSAHVSFANSARRNCLPYPMSRSFE